MFWWEKKSILSEEQPVKDFAFASVVTIKDVKIGEILDKENIWVKKPGTGEIDASEYNFILGKIAKADIPINTQLKWAMINE